MKKATALMMLTLGAVVGCKTPEPSFATKDTSTEQKGLSGFFVDPEFPGGTSILIAARRASPDSRYISLSRAQTGADAYYEHAMFFTGRDTHAGFEAIYYRYFVFAKPKSSPDWSSARVFDWSGDFIDPFMGPFELLEKNGKDPGKEPNPPSEPTAPSSRGSS